MDEPGDMFCNEEAGETDVDLATSGDSFDDDNEGLGDEFGVSLRPTPPMKVQTTAVSLMRSFNRRIMDNGLGDSLKESPNVEVATEQSKMVPSSDFPQLHIDDPQQLTETRIYSSS